MNARTLKQLEADLWRSDDTLRANSDLKSSEYSSPVLGLIFLKFADLLARPIGRVVLNSAQENRAYAILKSIAKWRVRYASAGWRTSPTE